MQEENSNNYIQKLYLQHECLIGHVTAHSERWLMDILCSNDYRTEETRYKHFKRGLFQLREAFPSLIGISMKWFKFWFRYYGVPYSDVSRMRLVRMLTRAEMEGILKRRERRIVKVYKQWNTPIFTDSKDHYKEHTETVKVTEFDFV